MLCIAQKFSLGAPPPKTLADGLRAPPTPSTPPTLAFPLIMFTSGIMFVFYLILFPAGVSHIHPGHNKTS